MLIIYRDTFKVIRPTFGHVCVLHFHSATLALLRNTASFALAHMLSQTQTNGSHMIRASVFMKCLCLCAPNAKLTQTRAACADAVSVWQLHLLGRLKSSTHTWRFQSQSPRSVCTLCNRFANIWIQFATSATHTWHRSAASRTSWVAQSCVPYP